MICSPGGIPGISKPTTCTSIFPGYRYKKGGMQGLRFSSRFGLRPDFSSARHVGKKEKRATSLDTAPRKGGSSNRSVEGCRLGIWTCVRYEGLHISPSPFFKESNAPLQLDKKLFINHGTSYFNLPSLSLRRFPCILLVISFLSMVVHGEIFDNNK